MGGKSSAQTVEDSLEAEEIQARFEELASSALGAPPVSSSQAAPLRNTSSVPYSAGKEGEEGRVVLDRWSAILQEDEPTGVLGLYLSGIPGWSHEAEAEGRHGKVLCVRPVCRRIASHSVVLDDGTKIDLCGAPDEETMLEAGFSWLVPVVLNGFPVDWEQQVNAGLEALTQGDEEEGAGTQEHSSALLEAPAAGLMPAHEEGYEGGEHKASKEGEAANEEQQEREDTLPLASVIKDEEGGRGKPSGQAAPGRAEEAKSDGGASERQGNGSKRTRAVCPDRGRSSQAEDTPLKQLAQVSRTCRRGRAARRSAAGCAAELGGNTLPLGANVGMGEDAGGQGDDAGGGAGGPVEDDAGEKVEAPAPGHEAGAKESEMKVQRAGQDDPSSNAKGEEKSQAKHLAGASGKASTATKAQTKAPAAGRGGGQGQAAAAPGRPVLPRSSKASETFLPLKPLNASSSSSAPAAAVLTTRSGRVCIAPLDFWRGERLVRDPRDSTPMGITAPYLESAQAKPLCRAGQGATKPLRAPKVKQSLVKLPEGSAATLDNRAVEAPQRKAKQGTDKHKGKAETKRNNVADPPKKDKPKRKIREGDDGDGRGEQARGGAKPGEGRCTGEAAPKKGGRGSEGGGRKTAAAGLRGGGGGPKASDECDEGGGEEQQKVQKKARRGDDGGARDEYVRCVIERVKEAKAPRPGGYWEVKQPTPIPQEDGGVILKRPKRAAANPIKSSVSGKPPAVKSATASACDKALQEMADAARSAKRARSGTNNGKGARKAAGAPKGCRSKAGTAEGGGKEEVKVVTGTGKHKQLTAREMGLSAKAPRMKHQGTARRGKPSSPQGIAAKAAASMVASILRQDPSPAPGGSSQGPSGNELEANEREAAGKRNAAAKGNKEPGSEPRSHGPAECKPRYATGGKACSGSKWSQEEVDLLNCAWASTDPLATNFWLEVAKKVPGRSASECFNTYMDRHGGASPAQTQHRKPTRYIAPVEVVAVQAALGGTGRPTQQKARKLVRHMRWQQRAEELSMGVGGPRSNGGTSLGPGSAADARDGDQEEGSKQIFLESMGRQERTDLYIEAILRRRRKAKAPSGFEPTDHSRAGRSKQSVSKLEEDIQQALVGAGGSDLDDEDEEEDYYFSDDEVAAQDPPSLGGRSTLAAAPLVAPTLAMAGSKAG